MDQHPAALRPELRRITRALLLMGGFGALWSAGVFVFSVRPPAFLSAFSHPLFHPGIIYSWYSCLHAFYVLLAVGLAHFLASRGWLRAAALACVIPGPGFLFGLAFILPASRIYRRLGAPEWKQFFEWKNRPRSTNDLTPAKRGKTLPS